MWPEKRRLGYHRRKIGGKWAISRRNSAQNRRSAWPGSLCFSKFLRYLNKILRYFEPCPKSHRGVWKRSPASWSVSAYGGQLLYLLFRLVYKRMSFPLAAAEIWHCVLTVTMAQNQDTANGSEDKLRVTIELWREKENWPSDKTRQECLGFCAMFWLLTKQENCIKYML